MCLPQEIKSFQNYRGVATTFYPTLVYDVLRRAPKWMYSCKEMSFFVAANIRRVVMSVEVHEVPIPSALLTVHGYVNLGTSIAKVVGLC